LIAETKVGYKIREAQMQKIPYMVVAGDKEIESKRFSSIKKWKNIEGLTINKLLVQFSIKILRGLDLMVTD